MINKWTIGLAAVGVVSLASVVKADEPAATTSTVLTALSQTTLSGYVDVSAQWSVGGQSPYGVTPPYTLGTEAGNAGVNGVNLNVVDIALDKPLDESQWSAGYHVELWVGPDANGLASNSGFSGGDFAIRQAYVSLRTPIGNGIDWKLGVFDTIIGYESISTPLNPNFTHSYGFALEPLEHTGLLGTYQVNDMITVQAGVADTSYANGYTSQINGAFNNGMSNPTILGSVAITAPDSWGFIKGGSIYAGIVQSSGTSALSGTSGVGGATSYYAGVSLPTPSTALKVGGSFDYLDEHDSPNLWDVAGYATFQATDKLSLNLRGEYFRNDGAVFDPTGLSPSSTILGQEAAENEAEELTLTAQYDLWKNVITRAEFRWDHTPSNAFFNNHSGGGGRDNAYLMALNVIYKF